jgi:phosphohistidine phosphatase SixA
MELQLTASRKGVVKAEVATIWGDRLAFLPHFASLYAHRTNGYSMKRIAYVLLVLCLAFPANATEAGWALLRNGGQTVLLNHANAPGTGDPANFDIEICRTQRNLSERGRHQARRIGALLAARSAPVEEVYTSRYCRARDTANLVFGEQNVETLEALDLISGEEQEDREAFEAILELINGYTGSGNLFMVTHPENVSAWAGVRSREGEAIIVVPEAEGLRVTGRVVLN